MKLLLPLSKVSQLPSQTLESQTQTSGWSGEDEEAREEVQEGKRRRRLGVGEEDKKKEIQLQGFHGPQSEWGRDFYYIPSLLL